MESKLFALADAPAVLLLVSPLLAGDFRHGFTMRQGGVSAAPFDSFNLGWKWGDDARAVDENHRRLLRVSGAWAMARASQVHGTRIVRVSAATDLAALSAQQADGLCGNATGLGLSVHVADCTPIVIGCRRTGACAALHAGWRGTVAGIAAAGVRTMSAEFGCHLEDLRVAIGPCIGVCCFEVGPEVVDAFAAADPCARENGSIVMGRRKEHIDLRRVQRLQLEAAGVPPANIDVSEDCTHCDRGGRFFSFRKAGRATGQMVGFIVPASPAEKSSEAH